MTTAGCAGLILFAADAACTRISSSAQVFGPSAAWRRNGWLTLGEAKRSEFWCSN